MNDQEFFTESDELGCHYYKCPHHTFSVKNLKFIEISHNVFLVLCRICYGSLLEYVISDIKSIRISK